LFQALERRAHNPKCGAARLVLKKSSVCSGFREHRNRRDKTDSRAQHRGFGNVHPFGQGKVLYFYSLLVAVFIFVVGECWPRARAFIDFADRNYQNTKFGTTSFWDSQGFLNSIPGRFTTGGLPAAIVSATSDMLFPQPV